MSNTPNDSSARSSHSCDGHNQSGPSTQRSTSPSAHSSPLGRSDSSRQWKVPLWVHCEQCFVTFDINPSLKLLSCGHILCVKCLRLDDANLHDSLHIPCVRCSSETYSSIGSLDSKLQGKFQQFWMDPVLQLDVSHMLFMMNKQDSYNKYLSKKIKEGNTLPAEWVERQNRVKARIVRIAKLKKMEQEKAKKTEAIKAETTKVHKNVCRLRSIYEKAKEYRCKQQQRQQQQSQQQRQRQGQQQRQRQGQQQRQQQGQQQRQQQGQQQLPPLRQQQLPSLRSREVEQTGQTHGRNEYDQHFSRIIYQYIGPLKSGVQSTNLNQSAPDVRNFSERVVPPARLNQSLDEPRGDSPRRTPDNASHRSAMPKLLPLPTRFNADNSRFELAQRQAPKRLMPSSAYDQDTNPPKRAAHYAGPVDLNQSKPSIGSST